MNEVYWRIAAVSIGIMFVFTFGWLILKLLESNRHQDEYNDWTRLYREAMTELVDIANSMLVKDKRVSDLARRMIVEFEEKLRRDGRLQPAADLKGES